MSLVGITKNKLILPDIQSATYPPPNHMDNSRQHTKKTHLIYLSCFPISTPTILLKAFCLINEIFGGRVCTDKVTSLK